MTSPTPSPVHVPVLARRCVGLLAPGVEAGLAAGVDHPVIIDATLGLGGHSELFLDEFARARVVGIDRDPSALAFASERLSRFGERFTGVHAVYDEIGDIASEAGAVYGILMDLGVSSMQLDEAGRGFAYSQDAPLDMRMDQTTGITAAELLATAPEADIRRILQRYGEERFAGRIAGAIVARRDTDPVRRSGQLVDLIRESIPAAARRTGGNPAKRSFQALRVAVNSELETLERAMPAAIDALEIEGRIVVMAYQSLEDRIVKRALTRAATAIGPVDMPIELPEHAAYLELLTRGGERATEDEIEENPRAKPARLRAGRKIRPTRKGRS